MASEWPLATVADIASPGDGSVAIGPFGSAMKASAYVDDGVPVIRGTNLNRGRVFEGEFKYVSKGTADKLRRSNAYAGDLVFPHRGAIGEVGIVPEGEPKRWMLSTSLMKLTCDTDKALPLFVYYFFRSRIGRHELMQYASTVGTPGIGQPLTSLKACRIPLPPIDEQRRIAAVLGALDDKIDLNRKMNRTLEEIAQAIFKSWFIDFDGVPDSEMVDSELGPIPKGWEVKSVEEIIQFNPRTKLSKGTNATFVDMKALPTMGCSVSEVSKKEMTGGGAKFVQGDTLLARITPCLENGKTALVDFLGPGEVAFGSTEFIVMRPRGPLSREWVYCLARSPEFRQHAISHMTGSSGRQRVPADCFGHFAMPEPPASTAQAFQATTSVLFDRIRMNADESRTLAELRDALLPKLISGEIRVPEAEAAVETAL